MRAFLATVSTGWDLMRWIRMGLGLTILFDAIKGSDWFMGVLALVLISQALFNVGCCGAGCTPSSFTNRSEKQNKTEDITYEEIK